MSIIDLIHVAVLFSLVAAAFLVFYLRDLLHTAIAFAAFSFLLAIEFFILQAPDVAIAEAGIGAGLTTAILVVALRSTTRKEFE
jgi:uncharacterized MnhB-related membrane protein